MWLGTKRMKRLAKAHLPPVYKHSHTNVIFTVNIPILYIHMAISDVCFHALSYLFILFISDFSRWRLCYLFILTSFVVFEKIYKSTIVILMLMSQLPTLPMANM